MQATLGEVFPCSSLSWKTGKACCVVYILRQHVTTVTSTPPLSPNQVTKQKKSLTFVVFTAYLALYVATCKEVSPTLCFREKVNSATKYLSEDVKYLKNVCLVFLWGHNVLEESL